VSRPVPRIVWTEEAEGQLTAVHSDEVVEELLALAAGLARFPERGRRVPELRDRPEYEIVREVILPRKARVFYLFVPDSGDVIILGLLPSGGAFRQRVLGLRFGQD
jgi:plasmid stabilization system protein ParE